MSRLLCCLLLILSCLRSEARIGETLDECIARYGPMEKIENAVGKFYSDYPQYCFTYQNILIRVRFLNGRSAQEEFYSSYFLDSEKREQIRQSNSKRETGFDVVVKETDPRLTITTEEFDKLMKKELSAGNF